MFIRGFKDISSLIHVITSVKRQFLLLDEHQEALKCLNKSVTTPLILEYYYFRHPFVVETDASSKGIGAVLAQKKVYGRIHLVQFTSITMNQTD